MDFNIKVVQPFENFEQPNLVDCNEHLGVRWHFSCTNDSNFKYDVWDENLDYLNDKEKINEYLFSLDMKLINLSMEYEVIHSKTDKDKDYLLEQKQKEIDEVFNEIGQKEYEVVQKRLDAKKDLVSKMIHSN